MTTNESAREAPKAGLEMQATAQFLYQVLDPHVSVPTRALLRLTRNRIRRSEAKRLQIWGRTERHALYRAMLAEHTDARDLYRAVMTGRF